MDQDVLGDDDYRQLLRLRTELRRFLWWSETQAKAAGITAGQHQLLLAIRGDGGPTGPTIGDVADHLLLKHHSAVELVQRAELAGLVTRHGDPDDGRLVRLAVSPAGSAALERLSALHVEELRRLAAGGGRISEGIGAPEEAPRTETEHDAPVAVRDRPAADVVAICRVYDRPNADAGRRILVDRLWPRGVRADDAPFDEWLSSVAPSSELRRWYDHDPERFAEFAERYRAELHGHHAERLAELAALAAQGPVTLVTATEDLDRSAASVLARELRARVRRRG